MISDILCSREHTRLEKTLLFFEAIRGTSNFNTLLESIGEPQTATDVANSIFHVENGEANVLINELLNGRLMVESYIPPVFGVFTDPNIPTIRTINGGEYICRTANPSIASEKYAICESISRRIGQLCAQLESEICSSAADYLERQANELGTQGFEISNITIAISNATGHYKMCTAFKRIVNVKPEQQDTKKTVSKLGIRSSLTKNREYWL